MKKRNDVLVRVQISGTRFVKMYKQDAIAQGLYKERKQVENKMLVPEENKKVEAPKVEAPKVEAPKVMVDFTTIPGVGVSASEKLQANGIHTFEDLNEADLDFLPRSTQKAIEAFLAGSE